MDGASQVTTETTAAANRSSLFDDVTSGLLDTVSADRSRLHGASTVGGGVGGSSPWLWAPHVAIGGLLVALMAASFVRFHCKYGHKYRTGSGSLGPGGFRTGPKNAWAADKKGTSSSTNRLPAAAAISGSVASGIAGVSGACSSMSTSVGGVRSTTAVIVLKSVGESGSSGSRLRGTSRNDAPLVRRSADPVLLGCGSKTSDARESAIELFHDVTFATVTTSAGSSNMSVDTANGSKLDVTDGNGGIHGENWMGSLATVDMTTSTTSARSGCSASVTSMITSPTGVSATTSGSNLGRWPGDNGGRKSATNDTTSFTSVQQTQLQQQQHVTLSPTNPFSTVGCVTESAGNSSSNFRSTQRSTGGLQLPWSSSSTTSNSAAVAQSSDWAFSEEKSLTSLLPSSSSVTSSVRGTLLRLQPALVSPSGERDTDKLLQTTDDTSSMDEKLVIL